MHIYVASSWRNTYYPEVVQALRDAGYEVYDFRLVFEIEFIKELFPNYKKVHLDIWQTFKDTTLADMLTK